MVYMNASGFSFVYPMLMSFFIFGGSLEFVAAEMLLSPFAPLQVFLLKPVKNLLSGRKKITKKQCVFFRNRKTNRIPLSLRDAVFVRDIRTKPVFSLQKIA